MRTIRALLSVSCVVSMLFAAGPTAYAKAKSSKPKNATAQCKDETYSTAKTTQGACSKHGGVKTWFGDQQTSTTTETKTKLKTKTTEKKSEKTAQVPDSSGAPQNAQNATAKCKDGTLSYSKKHSGACSHHGGVAEWYK